MTGYKTILVCIIIAFISIITANKYTMSTECIQCLCEGATGCNMTAGCQSTYAGAKFCGPFHISWPYWADAGKPTLNNVDQPTEKDFEACTNDAFCAARTVKQYLEKIIEQRRIDCNKDGVIDCIDFALTHKLGGYNCEQKDDRPTRFYKRFFDCWDKETGKDEDYQLEQEETGQ